MILNYGVLIGRFQGFHEGHLRQLGATLNVSERALILVGSTNVIRSQRNPLTYDERRQVIEDVIFDEWGEEALKRCTILPLPDKMYDLQSWVEQTRTVVRCATAGHAYPTVGLAGTDKDHTTYYLKLFPEWIPIEVDQHEMLNATAIRETWLTAGDDPDGFIIQSRDPTSALCKALPTSSLNFLSNFRGTTAFMELLEDREEISRLQARYGKGPFLAADAIVVQDDDVLLIQRGKRPHKGSYATPGGLLEPHETLLDCAIRELFEETQLDVLGGVTRVDLLAGLRTEYTFDHPHRSDRGRWVSQGFLFVLAPSGGCHPEVKGSDDAGWAGWKPIAEVRNEDMFDDHGFIIERLLRQAKYGERIHPGI